MYTAGAGLGGMANSTLGALTGAGQTAANITGGAINSGVGLAGAYSNLGNALSQNNLTNTNALLAAGNQQQTFAQNPLTAAYTQAVQQYQDPYAKLNFLRDASRGLMIPSTTNTQGTQTTSGSATGAPSPAGALTGILSSVMSIPGVTDWMKGSGAATNGGPPAAGTVLGGTTSTGDPNNPYSVSTGIPNYGPSDGSSGLWQKKGGYISRPRARRYATGGNVPIAKGMLSNPGPSMRAMMGTQGRPPMMNPGMGQMMGPLSGPMAIPPPMMGGALRGMGGRNG
jgi:hypothetical protein